MRRLITCALAVAMIVSLRTEAAPAAAPGEQAAWSEPSNGLRARLSMRRWQVLHGTGIVATYLELESVGHVGIAALLTVNGESMTFRVTDADGRNVPMHIGNYSGKEFGTPELALPPDSSMRVRISPCCSCVPSDQAALVDFAPNAWVLPKDGKAYYLHAVLEIAEARDDRIRNGTRWHGRLELPRVRIPTEPEPVDPASLGPLIEDLGARMLTSDDGTSAAAVRELSLIDDPRVIPWYVKAVKTDRHELKYWALDRLSRFEGDKALEGLKIGMRTQGDDIGNWTRDDAEEAAETIRICAAFALARSPHPQAKALLLSMENDPAQSVRITVIRAAARMKTPESLAVLKRHTQDDDPDVRAEAARLLELRENGTTK